ncbi:MULTISPECIES: hypothetical protein [Pseudomonas]|nr:MULTISPECIES: hypothetical protein [Pseudomonas]QIA03854.1 hypothetical protein GZH78_17440 [Pseudomonas fluorescens]TFA85118.1 putative delta-60 repeat protein [Pseudomonas sp. LAIL14HWK12:I2]SCZ31836.1 delta-60 repeat domain-containing protein [Pseudomonas sp. NFIX46]SDB20751.1 delta-60 repeat domain-containing protein [Pseudomonas putida]SFQ93605.1 delta-60 repeat domain-containing protein [Pseudomonas sp. NFIX49]
MSGNRSPAHLDETFGERGKVTIHIPGPNSGLSRIQGLVTDSKDRTLLVSSTADNFVLGRIAADGTTDESYANHGFVLDKFANEGKSSGLSIRLLEDESILLHGSHQNDGQAMAALACFNNHGNYKTEFGKSGKIVIPLPVSPATSSLPAPSSEGGHSSSAPIVFPDGKILFIHNNYLIQILSSGQPDNDFNNGKPYIDIRHPDYPANIYKIIKVSDNLIGVAGNANVDNRWVGLVAMYTAAGEQVRNFADNGYLLLKHLNFPNNIVSIAKSNSGTLLIAGQKMGFPNKGYITSVTHSGDIAQDFNEGKPVLTPNDESRSLSWHDSLIDQQGRIIATGNSMESGTAPSYLPLARILQNGKPDLSFNKEGLFTLDDVQLSEAIAIDSQERLLVGAIIKVNSELKPVLMRILA